VFAYGLAPQTGS